MYRFKIRFHTADQIIDFVRLISQYKFDADLNFYNKDADAKSLIGVFSMTSITNKMELVLHTDKLDNESFKNRFSEYLI